MDKKQLIKFTSANLCVWTFSTPVLNGASFFILGYDLEETSNKARQIIINKLQKENNNYQNIGAIPLGYIGKIPVLEILNCLDEKILEEKKLVPKIKEPKESINNFICNLKLTAEKFIKSKKDKDELNKIISKLEK